MAETCPSVANVDFYPRSPCGERLGLLSPTDPRQTISIHALLAESDRDMIRDLNQLRNFYPRSPCGERPKTAREAAKDRGISIHALLAESDGKSGSTVSDTLKFLSTLSLRRATPPAKCTTWAFLFLSTLSLRRATLRPLFMKAGYTYFYPRSPCGERR